MTDVKGALMCVWVRLHDTTSTHILCFTESNFLARAGGVFVPETEHLNLEFHVRISEQPL